VRRPAARLATRRSKVEFFNGLSASAAICRATHLVHNADNRAENPMTCFRGRAASSQFFRQLTIYGKLCPLRWQVANIFQMADIATECACVNIPIFEGDNLPERI
jgi:hypothetical protein